ncbi:MAG: hypothetical protein U1E36_00475 [Rickettsiales bacterium]
MTEPKSPALSPDMLKAMLEYQELPLLGKETSFTFDAPRSAEGRKVDMQRIDGYIFKNGDFKHPELAAAAQRVGAEIKKHGSPELQTALGANDKSASNMQIGAKALAAGMEYFREYEGNDHIHPTGVTAKFHNSFNQSTLTALKDPAFAKLVDAVAKDIVSDNDPHATVTVNTEERNRELGMLSKQAKHCGRCL